MYGITTSTLALPSFVRERAFKSMWAAPVQGIRMSGPVSGLTTSAVCAAKGANTQDAAGHPAFEDPT
jgi:hypothetical protein